MPSHDAKLVPFAPRTDRRRFAEPIACKRIAFAAVLACVRDLPKDEAGYPIIPPDRVPVLAKALRAFEGADERERIAKGRPLPGSLRPERKSKRVVQRVTGPLGNATAAKPAPSTPPDPEPGIAAPPPSP